MNLDRRLIHQLGNNRLPLVFTIFFGLLVAVFTISQAAILSRVINLVFLHNSTLNDVLFLLILFGLISLFRALSQFFEQKYAIKIAVTIKEKLRNQFFDHILKLGPIKSKSEHSGEISNTLLRGIDALEAYFSQYLPQIFLSAIIPITILFFIFPLDLLSGIVFLLTAPLIPIFMVLIGNTAEVLTKKQWKTLSRLSSYFFDVLQGLTTLKIFNKNKDQIEVIAKISNDYRFATMKVLRVAFLSSLSLEMLSTISTAIIAVEIGLRLLYSRLDFGSALFILILAPEFYLPLRALGAKFHSGIEGASAAKRIFQILEQPFLTIPKNHKKIDLKNETIQFKNVFFIYEENKPEALKNISFQIKPGQKVAFVGPSGSGKTTISNLLLKFIQPNSGEIIVGDQNFSDINPEELRKQITWIPQHPYLFNTSVEENISLANPIASHQEIVKAAKFANIHDFILSLPDDYKTIIGEQGFRLSGGEAQRIAIARAFLKDSPLIIMDEPTANLDPKTEYDIQKSIEKLYKNRTVLIIAHRIKTVSKADQIIVVSKGKINEQGNHQELLANKGAYFKLIEAFLQELFDAGFLQAD